MKSIKKTAQLKTKITDLLNDDVYGAEYLYYLFSSDILSFAYYRRWFYKSIPGFGLLLSTVILVLMYISITFVHYCLNKKRKLYIAIGHALIAPAAYSLFCYRNDFLYKVGDNTAVDLSIVTLVIVLLFCGLSFVVYCFSRWKADRYIVFLRKFIITFSTITLIFLGICKIIDHGRYYRELLHYQLAGREKETYDNGYFYDNINFLDEGTFRTLDMLEKRQLIESMARTECYQLGIIMPTIIYDDLDKNILGQYNDFSRTITLNNDLFDYGIEAIAKTLFHELFHSYQYRMIELYDLLENNDKSKELKLLLVENIEYWRVELYDRSETDYHTDKISEVDADRYADKQFESYLNIMKEKTGK